MFKYMLFFVLFDILGILHYRIRSFLPYLHDFHQISQYIEQSPMHKPLKKVIFSM